MGLEKVQDHCFGVTSGSSRFSLMWSRWAYQRWRWNQKIKSCRGTMTDVIMFFRYYGLVSFCTCPDCNTTTTKCFSGDYSSWCITLSLTSVTSLAAMIWIDLDHRSALSPTDLLTKIKAPWTVQDDYAWWCGQVAVQVVYHTDYADRKWFECSDCLSSPLHVLGLEWLLLTGSTGHC